MTEPTPSIEQETLVEQREEVIEKAQFSDLQSKAMTMTMSRVCLPRIAIKYCTQCKWMLRAAYFAQELLSTFNANIGEIALIPTTGGVFMVTILHSSPENFATQERLLWDRKTHGGFPEIKQLKSLVRGIVDPTRNLGHVDRALGKEPAPEPTIVAATVTTKDDNITEDSAKDTQQAKPETPSGEEGEGKVNNTKQDDKKIKCEDCQ